MFSFKKVGIVLLVVLAFDVAPNNGQKLTLVSDKCKARIEKPKPISFSEVAGKKVSLVLVSSSLLRKHYFVSCWSKVLYLL